MTDALCGREVGENTRENAAVSLNQPLPGYSTITSHTVNFFRVLAQSLSHGIALRSGGTLNALNRGRPQGTKRVFTGHGRG